jgi:hypothetical protein
MPRDGEGVHLGGDECGPMRTMFIAYWIVILFGLAGSILVGLTGR